MAAIPPSVYGNTCPTCGHTSATIVTRGFAPVHSNYDDLYYDPCPRAREKEKAGLRLSAEQHHRLYIRWLEYEADKEERWLHQRWEWEPCPLDLFIEYFWHICPPEGLYEGPDLRLKLLRFVLEPLAR